MQSAARQPLQDTKENGQKRKLNLKKKLKIRCVQTKHTHNPDIVWRDSRNFDETFHEVGSKPDLSSNESSEDASSPAKRMSQKRKSAPVSAKSVTSLPSVRSNEDDDDESSEESAKFPKSQISIGSNKSLSSSPPKKDRAKQKDKPLRRTKSSRKSRDQSLTGSEEVKSDTKLNEQEKAAESLKSPKEVSKELPYPKQLLKMPVLLGCKRSAEPPPTLEENSSERFTPSEIKLYLDNEKDLTETAITKKQQSLVLENLLKVPPNIIAPTLKTKENADDQLSETSSSTSELENLIFADIDKLPVSFRTPRVSIDLGQGGRGSEDSKISKEMSDRLENLIMDPSIFDRAIEIGQQQQVTKTASPPSLVFDPTNQLGTTSVPTSTPTKAPTSVDPAAATSSGEPLPKDIKFDNAIVLFSYAKAKKARKKKKRRKRAELRIGLMGAGKMTETIVNTLVNSLKFNPNMITVASPSGRNLDWFKSKGCQTTKRNIDLFTRYFCHIIFINVYGGVVRYCYKLGGLKPFPLTISFVPVSRHRYFIFSLVSGVGLEEVRDVIFNPDQIDKYNFEIHRILLNVSTLTKTSICAIDCEITQLPKVIKIFLSKFGELEYLPDKEMDAACAIAGSGLAFAFYFLNAISDGSVKIGMTKDKSIRLVSQIVISSVECFNRTQDESCARFYYEGHPALVGLECLKKLEVAAGIENAIKTAYNRIIELATMEITPQFNSD